MLVPRGESDCVRAVGLGDPQRYDEQLWSDLYLCPCLSGRDEIRDQCPLPDARRPGALGVQASLTVPQHTSGLQ